jgi:multiple sugar transport system permease protein
MARTNPRDAAGRNVGSSGIEDAGMSSLQHVLAARPAWLRPPGPPAWHSHLHGNEFSWAIAFVVPYVAVLLVFAIYPIAYGIWMAANPSLYAHLFADDEYLETLLTTALYVGFGVNINMFLALLLSGYFMQRRWWIKALLVISMVPWALPAQPAFISFHWMLIYPGLFDAMSWKLFGVDGPDWFANYWTALSANIVAYNWKTMPFWTVILLAGRMAIPQDLYDAADIDGATGLRRFIHVVVPLLANVYLACTLLATIWMIGDFNTPDIVSSGAPNGSTDVLATLGVDYLFDKGKPALGVAAVMSALPVLIPIGILLMRRLQTREVQL